MYLVESLSSPDFCHCYYNYTISKYNRAKVMPEK